MRRPQEAAGAPAEPPWGVLCKHQSKVRKAGTAAALTGQSAKQSTAKHSTYRAGTCQKVAYSAMHNVHSAKKLQQWPAKHSTGRRCDHTALSYMLLRAGCRHRAEAEAAPT